MAYRHFSTHSNLIEDSLLVEGRQTAQEIEIVIETSAAGSTAAYRRPIVCLGIVSGFSIN